MRPHPANLVPRAFPLKNGKSPWDKVAIQPHWSQLASYKEVPPGVIGGSCISRHNRAVRDECTKRRDALSDAVFIMKPVLFGSILVDIALVQ